MMMRNFDNYNKINVIILYNYILQNIYNDKVQSWRAIYK